MKLFAAFSILTAAPSLVVALAFEAPVPTRAWQGIELEPQGWSAAPTQAPSIFDLLRRQQILVPGLIVGPDGTCGFTSGSSDLPFGVCCSTCSCGFATTPGHYGGLYCCDSSACAVRSATTCIDGPAFSSGNVCNSACAADRATIKCTNSPNTLCNLVEFETVNVQAVYCDSTKVSGTQSLYTTFAGQTDHVFSPFNSASQQSSSSSDSQSTSSADTTTASTTQTGSTTTTTTSSPTTTTAPPGDASSSPPIGAIVGGSVGGVAVIAIVAFLVIFCLRRRSRASIEAAPQARPQARPDTQVQQPLTQPAHPNSYYSPQAQYPESKPAAQYQPVQEAAAPGYSSADHYSQPAPYDPSAATSPYSHHSTIDPQAIEGQGPNRHTHSTLGSGYSAYSPPPAGPPMSELGNSGQAYGYGTAGRHEVQG